MKIVDRRAYAEMYGPTTGDRVRLGDTDLLIEIERDHTVYGEEVTFGGGKVIRDGMGQSQRAGTEVADLVITNAVVMDVSGIVKADVGIKEGRISAIRKPRRPTGRRHRDWTGHGDHRRRGMPAHAGRHRHAHPLHLAPAGGARVD